MENGHRVETAASPAPIRSGVYLAALAALLFGITSPLLQRASHDAGVFTSAGLLYLGAAIASMAALGRSDVRRDAPLRRGDTPRLVGVAALGAVLAPAALVLGLKLTDAASAALLLALEAPFTLILARIAYGERLGRRVLAAVALVLAGSVVLAGGRLGTASSLGGCGLVALATLLWAGDNTLSRGLADRNPVTVVAGKGLLGGMAALVVAAVAGERHVSPGVAVALVAIGGVGYGASLQVYLRAQRLIGAGRTASVFAMAPLAGALAALAMGAASPGWPLAASAVLILGGVWLHASERHGHAHRHEAVEHEHLHVHDDGHHGHAHEPAVVGPHSHPHRHAAVEHDHQHGEDLHHLHPH